MAMFTPGNTFNERYVLNTMLGQGSFAEVWRAYDTRLQQRVVLKIMKTELAKKDELRRRFIEEARIMASLARSDHIWRRRITEVSDVSGPEDEVLYMALEFVPGGDLKKKLLIEKPSINAALRMFLMILHGVHVAHYRVLDGQPAEVLHRDIKPENILLTDAGEPKITDFGVAKSRHSMTETGAQAAEFGTRIGLRTGTIGYASPEQLSDSSSIKATSDIYSLGVLLAELVADFDPCTADLYLERTQKTLLTNVPDDIRGVIVRACDAQPDKRFQTIDELIAATEALLDAHPETGEPTWTAREKKAERKPEVLQAASPTVAPEEGENRGILYTEIGNEDAPHEAPVDDRKKSGLWSWVAAGLFTRLFAPILIPVFFIVLGIIVFPLKESEVEVPVDAPTEVAAFTEPAPITVPEPASDEPEVAPDPVAALIEAEEPAIATTEAESVSVPIEPETKVMPIVTAQKSEPEKVKAKAPKVEVPKVEAVTVTKVTILNPVSTIGAEGTIKVEASIVLPEGKKIGNVTLRWKGSASRAWESTAFEKGKASASFRATAAMGTSVQYYVDVRLADKPGEPNKSTTVTASITR